MGLWGGSGAEVGKADPGKWEEVPGSLAVHEEPEDQVETQPSTAPGWLGGRQPQQRQLATGTSLLSLWDRSPRFQRDV